MTAPPITNDAEAQTRALIWQPYDTQQPLTVTVAYLLDLLSRAGAMPDGYRPWGDEVRVQASGYDDPMPPDLPDRSLARMAEDEPCSNVTCGATGDELDDDGRCHNCPADYRTPPLGWRQDPVTRTALAAAGIDPDEVTGCWAGEQP